MTRRPARMRRCCGVDRLRCSGTLVIPAFALGRVQDVLFDLHWIVAEDPARYAEVGFHLDAPSAHKMNAVILEAASRTENNGRKGKVRPLWLGKQMFRWFGLDDTDPNHVQTVLDICRMTLQAEAGSVRNGPPCGNTIARAWRPVFGVIKNRRQFTRDESTRASVFVVSSGSCDGGPAAWWLPKLLSSTENIVALAGFCSAGTVGGQLLSLAHAGSGERQRLTGAVTWPSGASIPMAQVGAEIISLSGYSAHADQSGLLDWIFGVRDHVRHIAGRAVFIQHGGDVQRQQLAKAIETRALDVGAVVEPISPSDPDVWFDLDRNASEISEEVRLRHLEDEIARLSLEVANRRSRTQFASRPAEARCVS